MSLDYIDQIVHVPFRSMVRLPYRATHNHGDLSYDLTDLTYTGNFFSFLNEDIDCFCPLILNNGKAMYVNGADSDRIYEYSLGTAYDVTTATLTDSFDYSSQSATSTAMWISPDGKYLFLGDDIAGFVRRYTFGTEYEINTLSYDGVALAISQTTDGLTFSNDGTIMLAYEEDDSTWHQYDLSTPWDLLSASSGHEKLVQDDGNYGSLTADGRNVIAVGQAGTPGVLKLLIRELASANDILSAEALTEGQTPMISDGKGAFFIEVPLKFYGLSVNNLVYEFDVWPGP